MCASSVSCMPEVVLADDRGATSPRHAGPWRLAVSSRGAGGHGSVSSNLLVRAVFTALLPVLLHAQARAPFTGTVRDEDGKGLANFEVTCAFVPDDQLQ